MWVTTFVVARSVYESVHTTCGHARLTVSSVLNLAMWNSTKGSSTQQALFKQLSTNWWGYSETARCLRRQASRTRPRILCGFFPRMLNSIAWSGRLKQLGDHEGHRHTITAHLPKSDIHDVAQKISVQNAGDCIAHIQHEHVQTAMRLVRTGTAFISGHAYARDRGQWTIDEPDDLTETDFLWRLGQQIPSRLPSPSFDVTGAAQLSEDLLQEFHG